MKYALGNMLNGAGGLNADQLALDLQFAADKSLTARKGPTPTFTRASSGTFVGSDGLIQSAGNNVARFDHDPVTLASKGLLIEGSRENLLNGSQTFATSGGTQNNWVDTNITRDGTLRTSPDGTANALRITASAANGTIISSAAAGSSAARVFSIFLKRVAGTGDIQYTLDNGSTWTTQAITNSWVRYAFNVTTANQQVGIRIVTDADAIELWGAQLEAGSHASSYIPTTSARVVRSADVCSITGAAFSQMWNATEGVLFASGDKGTSTTESGSYFSFQAGATEVGPLMTRTSTTLIGRIRNNAGTDLTNTDTSQSPTGEKKVAVTWKATSDTADRDYASGGVILVKTNPNAGTAANNQTAIIIGGRPSSTWFNGTISAIRYYRKRLDNSKLASLTA